MGPSNRSLVCSLLLDFSIPWVCLTKPTRTASIVSDTLRSSMGVLACLHSWVTLSLVQVFIYLARLTMLDTPSIPLETAGLLLKDRMPSHRVGSLRFFFSVDSWKQIS